MPKSSLKFTKQQEGNMITKDMRWNEEVTNAGVKTFIEHRGPIRSDEQLTP